MGALCSNNHIPLQCSFSQTHYSDPTASQHTPKLSCSDRTGFQRDVEGNVGIPDDPWLQQENRHFPRTQIHKPCQKKKLFQGLQPSIALVISDLAKRENLSSWHTTKYSSRNFGFCKKKIFVLMKAFYIAVYAT